MLSPLLFTLNSSNLGSSSGGNATPNHCLLIPLLLDTSVKAGERRRRGGIGRTICCSMSETGVNMVDWVDEACECTVDCKRRSGFMLLYNFHFIIQTYVCTFTAMRYCYTSPVFTLSVSLLANPTPNDLCPVSMFSMNAGNSVIFKQ